MPQTPFSNFVREVQRIEHFRSKQEGFVSRGLGKNDIRLVYEIIFLSLFVALETFLENQLIGIVSGKPLSSGKRPKLKLEATSPISARNAIYGLRNYFDYFPFQNTARIAKVYVSQGVPFSMLQDADLRLLENGQCIRNAIAHKSRHSISRFKRQVLSQLMLRPSQQNPADYLRSPFSVGVTRYENYSSEYVRIAQALS